MNGMTFSIFNNFLHWVLQKCPVVTKMLQIHLSHHKETNVILSNVGGNSFTSFEVKTMENEIEKALRKVEGNAFVLDVNELKIIGCGTIGRVYLYQDKLVFKVKIPNIEKSIAWNYMWLKPVLFVVDSITLYSMHLSLRVNTFMQTIREQFDFVKEIQSMKRWKANLQRHHFRDEDVTIPTLYEFLCTENVICMEYINGETLTDCQHKLSERETDILTKLYISNVIKFDCMHADMHGGNVIIRDTVGDNKQVVVIDFGMTQTNINAKRAFTVIQCMHSMFTGDMERFAKTACTHLLFLDKEYTTSCASNKEIYEDFLFCITLAYHKLYDEPLFSRLQGIHHAIDKWTLPRNIYGDVSSVTADTTFLQFMNFVQNQKVCSEYDNNIQKYIESLLFN